MSGPPKPPIREALETVQELRERLGLFSFRNEARTDWLRRRDGLIAGARPSARHHRRMVGGEARAGALTSALQILSRCLGRSRSLGGRGPGPGVATSRRFPDGASIRPGRCSFVPATLQETCWAIEQCLRCPGVVGHVGMASSSGFPDRVLAAGNWRRKSAEAWACFSAGLRPDGSPSWADLRLLRHAAGLEAEGEARRMQDRRAVSPGRPRRQRPGLGDRPCRG